MRLTKEEADRILIKSIEMIKIYPKWRMGQSFFNTLYMDYPELADEIRATEYDPFYTTDRIPYCMDFITIKKI